VGLGGAVGMGRDPTGCEVRVGSGIRVGLESLCELRGLG